LRIAPDDWDLTAGDTNLNGSSHPATNRATGIGLSPLLEAIEKDVWITIYYVSFSHFYYLQCTCC
jgi:hypothetical protein